MNLLLDTHVAIWAIESPERFPLRISDLITSVGNRSWVSVISLAEISIKYPLSRGGLGDMPVSAETALERFEDAGFELLDLSARHAVALEKLPLIHRDPFDRLLIAQASEEPMRLVTHDFVVASYNTSIIHF